MAPNIFPELQAFAAKLLHKPPATLPTSEPLSRPDYADSCADLLAWWSTAEGWPLGAVFRDTGVSSDTLVRPGFAGLLDVLRLPDSAGVLLVDSTHLSASTSGATRLTLAARRTGGKVRTLADELHEVRP